MGARANLPVCWVVLFRAGFPSMFIRRVGKRCIVDGRLGASPGGRSAMLTRKPEGRRNITMRRGATRAFLGGWAPAGLWMELPPRTTKGPGGDEVCDRKGRREARHAWGRPPGQERGVRDGGALLLVWCSLGAGQGTPGVQGERGPGAGIEASILWEHKSCILYPTPPEWFPSADGNHSPFAVRFFHKCPRNPFKMGKER